MALWLLMFGNVDTDGMDFLADLLVFVDSFG